MNKKVKRLAIAVASLLMLSMLSSCASSGNDAATPTDDAGPAPTGNFRGNGQGGYAYDNNESSKKKQTSASQNVTYDLTDKYDYLITSNISSINQYSGKISSDNNTDGRDVKNLEIKPAGDYKITFKSANDDESIDYIVYNNDSIKDKDTIDSNDSAIVELKDGTTLFIKGKPGTLTMTTINDACDIVSACSMTDDSDDNQNDDDKSNDASDDGTGAD